MYLWSVFTLLVLFVTHLSLSLQHRPIFSRLTPIFLPASATLLKTKNLPLSETAMTCLRGLPAPAGRLVHRCVSRFFQPLDIRLRAFAGNDLCQPSTPLLCGTWPCRKRPVVLSLVGRSGGMYSSQLILVKIIIRQTIFDDLPDRRKKWEKFTFLLKFHLILFGDFKYFLYLCNVINEGLQRETETL